MPSSIWLGGTSWSLRRTLTVVGTGSVVDVVDEVEVVVDDVVVVGGTT